MTTLDSDFETALEEALLEDAEAVLSAELGPRLVALARERWEAYASRNDYDIAHIWQDATLEVTREADTVTLSIQWPELTALFEFGVSPHTIEGDPVLHLYYERIGEEITVASVEWGSETGGIPESRAIRDALRQFRRGVSA